MLGNRAAGIEDHASIMLTYLEQVNLLPGSGEFGIVYLLYPGAWAKKPLCNRLMNLNIPMAFFFGDRDWVKPDGAEELQKRALANVKIYTITDSDHHLYWDNPKELIENIFDALNTLE